MSFIWTGKSFDLIHVQDISSRLHNEDSSLFLNHSYSAFSSSTTFTSCCPVSRGLIWSFCGVSSDKSPICHSVSCIRRLLPSLLSQHACYVTRVLANVPAIHWNWSGYKVQVSLWSVCTAHCSYCYSPNLTRFSIYSETSSLQTKEFTVVLYGDYGDYKNCLVVNSIYERTLCSCPFSLVFGSPRFTQYCRSWSTPKSASLRRSVFRMALALCKYINTWSSFPLLGLFRDHKTKCSNGT